MYNWNKVFLLLFIVLIIRTKCVSSASRRGSFRSHRKGSSSTSPFPPSLSMIPPRVAAAQNFNPEYELPPFMMTSYGEPIMDYGPPRTPLNFPLSKPSTEYGPPKMSTDFGITTEYGPPRPSTEYGSPRPSTEYGAPRPSTEFGSPRPSTEYGAPRPSTEYGPPKLSTEYGPPSSTVKPIIHKHIYVHIPPPEPEIQSPR